MSPADTNVNDFAPSSSESPVEDDAFAFLASYRAASAALPQAPEEPEDGILIMRVGAKYSAAKTFTVAEGKVETLTYSAGAFFRHETETVAGLHAVHQTIADTCDGIGGAGYLVYGRPPLGSRAKTITRRKSRLGTGTGRSLVDAPRRWLILDFDAVPNVAGIDPRRDPAAAVAFFRSLLPPVLRQASVSWQFSSSMCVAAPDGSPLGPEGIPETLSGHLHFWLSEPLLEAARRSLMRRLSAHAGAALEAIGGSGGTRPIDAGIATYNQAIYVGRPRFVGMPDPFPGDRRYGLLLDGPQTVDVGRLMEQLPALVTTPTKDLTPEQKAERAAKRRQTINAAVAAAAPRLPPVWKREPLNIEPIPTMDDVHEKIRGLIRSRCADLEAASARGSRNVAANRALCYARALGEIPRIVAHRVATDDRWAAADGVPDGCRNSFLMIVSSMMSFLFPVGTLQGLVREYAAPLIEGGLAAIENGWTESCEYHVLRRARDDEDGIVPPDYVAADGKSYKSDSARYGYKRDTIIEILGVSEAEMVALDLQGLRTTAVRFTQRRRDAGVPTVEERRAVSLAATKPWTSEGKSRTRWFEDLRKQKIAAGDTIALLESMSYGSPEAQADLEAAGFATFVPGDLASREEVRDLIAWLRLAANRNNVEAFRRIANRPGHGLGGDMIEKAVELVRNSFGTDGSMGLGEALSWEIGSGRVVGLAGSREGATILGVHLQTLADAGNGRGTTGEIIAYVLEDVGYAAWAFSQPEAAPTLRASLNAVTAIAAGLPDVCQFLDGLETAAAEYQAQNAQDSREGQALWTPDAPDTSIGDGGVGVTPVAPPQALPSTQDRRGSKARPPYFPATGAERTPPIARTPPAAAAPASRALSRGDLERTAFLGVPTGGWTEAEMAAFEAAAAILLTVGDGGRLEGLCACGAVSPDFAMDISSEWHGPEDEADILPAWQAPLPCAPDTRLPW